MAFEPEFARDKIRGWVQATALILSCLAPLSTVPAQQRDSAARGAQPLLPHVSAADTLDSGSPVPLNGGCHAVRAVALGLGGYLGYLIGSLGALPLALADAPESAVIGAEALGTFLGAVWIADAPMSRPLPLCPSSLRTLSGRPTDHVAACRASRVLAGALGASEGAVLAVAAALPLVLTNQARRTVSVLIIAVPAVGAVGAAVRAGRRPPCKA